MIPDYQPLAERHDVTADIFREDIMPAGQPVILKGLVKDWELVKTAAQGHDALADYLIQSASSTPVNVFSGRPEIGGKYYYNDTMKGFNFDRKDMSFAAFMQSLLETANHTDADSLYMGSQPVPQILPGLESRCPMPLTPDGVPPRIWIGNSSVVSPHYDMDRNIACVITGKRRFILFPPQQVKNLYPGPIENNMAGPQVGLIDPENPDFETNLRFKDAIPHGRVADMEPGDALYIPPLWWHQVRATGPFNILINYWWPDLPDYSRAPTQAFVLGLLAIRQQPKAEREAWQALFNYFVFKTEIEEPPMAHLPDDVQGVLGDISPQRAQQLWHYFVSLMK